MSGNRLSRSSTTLLVKNMVCNRCIRVVREELTLLGLDVRSVRLGEVVVGGNVEAALRARIERVLHGNGFELIQDRRSRTIERIKHAVLKLVYEENPERRSRVGYPRFVEEMVGQEYRALSALFSSVENVTIEQYVILQKIERVKELLKYNQMTLSEIAYSLGYSSVPHLSYQFKRKTGLTPSQFKSQKNKNRVPLGNV